jgi:hypothetical protein
MGLNNRPRACATVQFERLAQSMSRPLARTENGVLSKDELDRRQLQRLVAYPQEGEPAKWAQTPKQFAIDPISGMNDGVRTADPLQRLPIAAILDSEHMLRAETPQELLFPRRARHRDHLGAERGSVLHGKMTEPTDPDNGASLTRPELGVAQSRISGEASAEKGCRLDGVDSFGDSLNCRGIDRGELGMSAIDCETRTVGRRTVLVPALGAVAASPAPALSVSDPDSGTDRRVLDVRSPFHDATHCLVARDPRERAFVARVAQLVDIRVADT